MSHPLVSIVIPCYNAEKWIAQTVKSGLAQTWPNKEIIVVDDGSTDGSLEIVKSFGDKVCWETGPNRGGCAARNRGAALAKGDYLQFLDADDLLHPEKIAHQMRSLDGSVDMASTCRLIVSTVPEDDKHALPVMDNLQMEGEKFLVNWHLGKLEELVNPEQNLKVTFGNSSSWVVPRPVFSKVGGWNERLVMCQDSEFFSRVAAACRLVEINADAYGYYRVGIANSVSGGMSRAKAESAFLCCQVVERLLEEIKLEDYRTAIAMGYFGFISRFYPYHGDLIKRAFGQINRVGIPVWKVISAPKLQLISRFIGVRAALTLRNFSRRNSV